MTVDNLTAYCAARSIARDWLLASPAAPLSLERFLTACLLEEMRCQGSTALDPKAIAGVISRVAKSVGLAKSQQAWRGERKGRAA